MTKDQAVRPHTLNVGHASDHKKLRRDIREELASGPSEPLDMVAIKAEARPAHPQIPSDGRGRTKVKIILLQDTPAEVS